MWIDIGKPGEFLQTNKIILDAEAKNLKLKSSKNFEVKTPVAIEKDVMIGENSVIGPYAILGRNITVGKNSQISNSVIFPFVEIGEDCQIEGALIGEGAKIGKHVKIGSGCIVGDLAKIKDNLTLSEGVTVCPAKEVTENILNPKGNC